jgi:S1-C subfamily serine protease
MVDTQQPLQSSGVLASLSNELAGAVERAAQSVVTVNGRRRMPASGIIWTDSGLIVTANHVVERDEDITINLGDGSTRAVTLIGRDQGSDIALLQLDGASLTAAVKPETEPKPGHLVLAVGRPGQSGPMASLGVISLVGGGWRTSEGTNVESFIRSDAAMLPGFSGGPLVDTTGATVGMNSSTVGRRGGLTIPFDAVDAIVGALRAHGKVRRGFLGVGAQSVELNTGLRESLGVEQERALVIVNVQADGPAEQSGLMIGDVILAVQDRKVATVEELQDYLSGEIVGQVVTVSLVRGGQLAQAQVTVGERGQ